MATLHETEQFEKEVFEFFRRSEEALLEAGRSWAKAVGELAPVEMPAVRDLVKGIFDFTEEALKTQREFAQKMLAQTHAAVMSAMPKTVRPTPTPKAAAPRATRPHRAAPSTTRKTTAA